MLKEVKRYKSENLSHKRKKKVNKFKSTFILNFFLPFILSVFLSWYWFFLLATQASRAHCDDWVRNGGAQREKIVFCWGFGCRHAIKKQTSLPVHLTLHLMVTSHHHAFHRSKLILTLRTRTVKFCVISGFLRRIKRVLQWRSSTNTLFLSHAHSCGFSTSSVQYRLEDESKTFRLPLTKKNTQSLLVRSRTNNLKKMSWVDSALIFPYIALVGTHSLPTQDRCG